MDKEECKDCVYLEADGEIINHHIEKVIHLEKERKVLIGLLTEARDRICLECYGVRPAPETVETMKKINKWLGSD